MGTADGMVLSISKRTCLGYLYNTNHGLLADLNMATQWTIQCESISGLLVDLYFESRQYCRDHIVSNTGHSRLNKSWY